MLALLLVMAGTRCEGAGERTAADRAGGPVVAAPALPAPSGTGDTGGGTGDGARGGNGAEGNGAQGKGKDQSKDQSKDRGEGKDKDKDKGANSGAQDKGTQDKGAQDGGRSASPRPTAPSSPPPAPLPRSRATTLRIPSLGIDAPVVGLGLDADRRLKTPPADNPNLVGWYKDGPTPGERGTAVAVGHRDTKKGAAVFAALGQVEPGRTIEVRRADGRTAVYTVDKVQVFDKDRFPDKEVYGPARRPELRVITCGGLYTHRTGYSSNVVVFAHLTATK
ncbi:class F sortase [Streptomyces thermoalcalitolerans]|uniref:class F sortase n=1 Tax=Streptomyces thermoalcalitolerans TaxID=65605 RepID=UPI0031DBD705